MLVNVFRSIPFIILLVAMLPLTRLIVGTTMGTWAAVVPLSAHLIPFFARVAQVGLNEVDPGLVEAARDDGCRRWHIVRHVLPRGHAGPGRQRHRHRDRHDRLLGDGGRGRRRRPRRPCHRYGYERYETAVMFNVIAIPAVLVTLVQFGGERLARRFDHRR